jgi:hypothetical protein
MNNNKNFWPVMLSALLVGVVIQSMFISCAPSSNTGNNAGFDVDTSSLEHRYATERFKQEGYSAKDARTAADAVMKFHNAQKNR